MMYNIAYIKQIIHKNNDLFRLEINKSQYKKQSPMVFYWILSKKLTNKNI